MASTKDYLFYVLELLREVEGISYRPMMGEYLLYRHGLVFGGIYDNRFLLKKSPALEGYGFIEAIPYPGGKRMYLVDIEDPNRIKELIESL